MRKFFFSILIILILPVCFIGTSFAEITSDIKPLPDFTLTVPESKAHVEYLGLTGAPGVSFSPADIDADLIVIELFSMYCPHCQNAAPKVNELYEKMEKIKGPDLKIVIIGIGVNNTELEVETFRKGYDIAFPLFSDPEMAIYKTLSGAGTPTFILSKKEGDKNVIVFRKPGGFTDAQEFLDLLLNRAGLNKEVGHAR